MGEKELLEFYQNQFNELQKKDDKYKEKVDKHLRELAADRHDLEAEVLRRGEKISDLQKALVDLQLSCFEERERFLNVSAENEKLKKNEENLHENIRHLLNGSKDKQLRDRIIYILEDPNVEVGYRYKNSKNSGTSFFHARRSSDEFLKEQVQLLQSKLDEHSKISQNKSDVILEDCKLALKKSREKLLQNDEEILTLKKKLQEAEDELSEIKQAFTNLQENVRELNKSNSKNLSDSNISRNSIKFLIENPSDTNILRSSIKSLKQNPSDTNILRSNLKSLTENSSDTNIFRNGVQPLKQNPPDSNVLKSSIKYSNSSGKIHPVAEDLHYSLVLLSEGLTGALSLLSNIQTTQAYVQTAKLPKSKASSQKYVSESDVVRLQDNIRQCNLLSFEVDNLRKSVHKETYSGAARQKVKELNVAWEFQELENVVDELRVATAEADLQSMGLSRATFFNSLTGPKPLFEKFGVKEVNNQSKYVSEVNKMESNLKSASNFVIQAVKFTGRISEKLNSQTDSDAPSYTNQYKVDTDRSENSLPRSQDYNKQDSLKKLSSNPSSKENSASEISNFRYARVLKGGSNVAVAGGRNVADHLTRSIDKTLAKINQIESGEYVKDDEFCRHLSEQVKALTEKLKELYDEFNMKSFQDQFSEYTSVTLSKLETLAKQSRDTAIAAEAQISAHRSNSRVLSQKLRDTEDLLRESIHECLMLKQKLQQAEVRRETEKAVLSSELQEKLQRVADFDELETAVKEVVSSIGSTRGAPITEPRKPIGPFECMYCKQGSDHKLCQEKIKELRSSNRKLSTELKLLQQEMKEEKKLTRISQEQADKATHESATQSDNIKGTLHSLQSKNAALLEQLKAERNKLKNMERFRRLEIEGFQTDIRNLKMKIQEIEKQLMKAVLIFEHDKKDQELLETVHATALRSKQATAAIKRLKAKLYELETDIKHL